MPRVSKRVTDIKRCFKKLDTNKDGFLTVDEMARLLRRGRADITDREVELLFKSVDKNGNGRVEFGEFVDYIFDTSEPPSPGTPRRSERRSVVSDRHRRQNWDIVADDKKVGWEHIKGTYFAYAGRNEQMEGGEFAKLCRECGLLDERLTWSDIDTIFAYVCQRGPRHMSPKQFESAIELLAEKKGCPAVVVRAKVGASSGPVFTATKPQEVRLHTDPEREPARSAERPDAAKGQSPERDPG